MSNQKSRLFKLKGNVSKKIRAQFEKDYKEFVAREGKIPMITCSTIEFIGSFINASENKLLA